MGVIEMLGFGKDESLYCEKTAVFVHDLLKPLVRYATEGYVASLAYRADGESEKVRVYMSDDGVYDVDVSGLSWTTMALRVLESLYERPM